VAFFCCSCPQKRHPAGPTRPSNFMMASFYSDRSADALPVECSLERSELCDDGVNTRYGDIKGELLIVRAQDLSKN
jgi:hypothetical protein